MALVLPPGTLITRLDDTALGTVDTSNDPWTEYLESLSRPMNTSTEELGWCVNESWFFGTLFLLLLNAKGISWLRNNI